GRTEAQRRRHSTEGGIQGAFTAWGAAQAGRGYLRGRQPTANRPTIEHAPPASGARPGNPPATPPSSTSGSNAGQPGSATRCQTSGGCFAAGTPIRTPRGSKLSEQFQPGELIL